MRLYIKSPCRACPIMSCGQLAAVGQVGVYSASSGEACREIPRVRASLLSEEATSMKD